VTGTLSASGLNTNSNTGLNTNNNNYNNINNTYGNIQQTNSLDQLGALLNQLNVGNLTH
jgi:hypothetical protein